MTRNYGLVLLVFLMNPALQADMFCEDNSLHLAQYGDPHEYHHVQCNCPCEKMYKILPFRGQCTRCGHYHRNLRTIDITAPQYPEEQDPELIAASLNAFIAKYRQQ